jgi:ankyrin repeat protein
LSVVVVLEDEERSGWYVDVVWVRVSCPARFFFVFAAFFSLVPAETPFYLAPVQGQKGGAPLDVVAVLKGGDSATLGVLLSKGLLQADGVDGSGRPYLVTAAKEGQLGAVKLLAAAGAHVNAVDAERASALAWSAANGHVGVARYLLKKEAQVDSRDQAGSSALDWAASSGHTGVVNLLLSNGADPNNCDSEERTALLWAAEKGHAGVARALLARQCDARHSDRLGRNALILAAQMGHVEVVQALVESELFDLGARDKQGMTALDHAAAQGKAAPAKLMLSRLQGEALVSLGGAALGWACSTGNAAAAAVFLEIGVRPDATDRDGASCLSRAAVRGHYETAKLLLEHGADPNLPDRKRNTPLHHTAFHGYTKVHSCSVYSLYLLFF